MKLIASLLHIKIFNNTNNLELSGCNGSYFWHYMLFTLDINKKYVKKL